MLQDVFTEVFRPKKDEVNWEFGRPLFYDVELPDLYRSPSGVK
jgi:hypothetical protein